MQDIVGWAWVRHMLQSMQVHYTHKMGNAWISDYSYNTGTELTDRSRQAHCWCHLLVSHGQTVYWSRRDGCKHGQLEHGWVMSCIEYIHFIMLLPFLFQTVSQLWDNVQQILTNSTANLSMWVSLRLAPIILCKTIFQALNFPGWGQTTKYFNTSTLLCSLCYIHG